jgi:hypothetical protein
MDLTFKYIEMCEKAVEIQAAKPWWDNRVLGFKIPHPERSRSYWIPLNAVWIPRQDQLQDIVREDESAIQLHERLLNWYCDPYGFGSMPFPKQIDKLEQWEDYVDSFTTMEQLWLAYVMWRKFGKIWTGQEWINKE